MSLDFSLTQMGVMSLIISYVALAAACILGGLRHTENYKEDGRVNIFSLLFVIVASLLWLPVLIFLATYKAYKKHRGVTP